MTVAIPALSLAWTLSEPCGTCDGCARRLRAEKAVTDVENSLFAAALMLSPESPTFDRSLDAIMRGRDLARADLLGDPLSTQCDELVMTVEEPT